MSTPGRRRLIVATSDGDGIRRVPDELVVEEPLTIVVNSTVLTTTMRTPGHDFELAVGYCVAEGILVDDAVETIRYCGDSTSASSAGFNRVEVLTASGRPPTVQRLAATTSSCGWCGSDQIDELVARMAPLPATPLMAPSLLVEVVAEVSASQPLFAVTGAVHGAARFDRGGSIEMVREDVGRHNAVDKVVGASQLAGRLPATGEGLFVSGRASVEMVQKAWAAGFTTLVAVSAPTALAVDAARRAGIELAGFVRGNKLNIYAPERPVFG